MNAVELTARYTRRPTRCHLCGVDVPVGVLVHVVADDDGRPRAAHINCNLDLLDQRWKARIDAQTEAF